MFCLTFNAQTAFVEADVAVLFTLSPTRAADRRAGQSTSLPSQSSVRPR